LDRLEPPRDTLAAHVSKRRGAATTKKKNRLFFSSFLPPIGLAKMDDPTPDQLKAMLEELRLSAAEANRRAAEADRRAEEERRQREEADRRAAEADRRAAEADRRAAEERQQREEADGRAAEARQETEEVRLETEEMKDQARRKNWPPDFVAFGKLRVSLSIKPSTATGRTASVVERSGRFAVDENIKFNTETSNTSKFLFNRGVAVTGLICSEADVAYHVRHLLQDLVVATGLSEKIKLIQELGTFSLRMDLALITDSSGTPIGFVEVKNPVAEGGASPLAAPGVLGEVYDYLELLHHTFGIRGVFGIITTMREWRVVWRNDEDSRALAGGGGDAGGAGKVVGSAAGDAADDAAGDAAGDAGGDDAPGRTTPPVPPGARPSDSSEPCPRCEVVVGDMPAEGPRRSERIAVRARVATLEDAAESYTAPAGADMGNSLCASAIYRIGDSADVDFNDGLPEAPGDFVVLVIANALQRMDDAGREDYDVDSLDHVCNRRFPVIEEGGGMHWAALRPGGRRLSDRINRFPAAATKYLWLLKCLGAGRDGRAWLACTVGLGAVCVIKICRKREGSGGGGEKVAGDAVGDAGAITDAGDAGNTLGDTGSITDAGDAGDAVASAIAIADAGAGGAAGAAVAKREADNWTSIYGTQFPVRSGLWDGRGAVLMQYFNPVLDTDRTSAKYLEMVRKVLTESFANQKYEHMDVVWRNIGTYIGTDANGADEQRAVLFDLTKVKKHDEEDWDGKAWVDACIEVLETNKA
jgi:hypothetical protein